MIAALEAGELVPSLTPLFRLARGLGVRLGTLLDDHAQAGPAIARGGDAGATVHFSGNDPARKHSTLDFHPLAPRKADRNMEPFLVDVHPAAGDVPINEHEGEEFILVTQGKVLLRYGKEDNVLEPGDTAYYNSIVPHYVGAMDGEAQIYAVIYYPPY